MNDTVIKTIMDNAVIADDNGSWNGIHGAYIAIFDADSIEGNGLDEPIGDRSLLDVAAEEDIKPWHCYKAPNAIDIAVLLQWVLDNGYPFELDTTKDDD